jgi:Predicted membrane protein
MSQNEDLVSPDNDTAAKNGKEKSGDLEWAYSGKAMRTQCVFYWIITILLFAVGIYLTMFGPCKDHFLIVMVSAVVLVALLWVQFFTVYFYRIWTIRYKLTDQRLYTYQGFFTKTSDSMELIFIEDIQMIQTLWDRMFNGGVGRIVIHSSADKTDSILTLKGIDNPAYIFDRIDEIRTELRKKRAIMQASG